MVRLTRWCTLLGYFSLVATIILWNAWLSPPVHFSRFLVLILLLTPLIFPARGLWRGIPYTHAWSGFLALAYFMLGISSVVIEQERSYGMSLSITSLVFFSSAIFFARYRGKEIRALSEKKLDNHT